MAFSQLLSLVQRTKTWNCLIRHVCPEWPSFDAVELHIRGLEYDSRRFSVTNFILDISVALNECLYVEN